MAQHCNAQQVCDDLLGLLSFYKSQLAKMAEEHNLSIMQLHALRMIDEGNKTMGAVAKVMHCDASNVTGIIDKLLTLGLVTRQESPQDRRVKTVELTPNGQALLAHIVRDMPKRLGCDRLKPKEMDAVHAAVLRLVA